MDDLFKKFSEAASIVSSNKSSMQESVYCAYVEHLSDINYDQKNPHLQHGDFIVGSNSGR